MLISINQSRLFKGLVVGLFCLLFISGLSDGVSAETPEEKGERIAMEGDLRDKGWGRAEAIMKMILIDKRGNKSERDLKQYFLESEEEDSGNKSALVFKTPRDISGTALLSHGNLVDDDDQWLYLPALKRVKRISSSNKTGQFVGSEFTYEDLNTQEPEKI